MFRIVTHTDATGTTTYAYDDANRQTGVSYPSGKSLAYAYNEIGLRTALTDALGGVTNYGYDRAGNLTSVVNPYDQATTIVPDALNRESTKTLGNGVIVSHMYDDAGRETLLAYKRADGSMAALAGDAGTASAGRGLHPIRS